MTLYSPDNSTLMCNSKLIAPAGIHRFYAKNSHFVVIAIQLINRKICSAFAFIAYSIVQTLQPRFYYYDGDI